MMLIIETIILVIQSWVTVTVCKLITALVPALNQVAGQVIAARAVAEIKGDADIWNYTVTLNLPDLFKKGNAGGVVVGMQPRLTGTSNNILAEAIGLPAGQRKDRDIGLHIEAFYRYQLNDNISITPGFFWLIATNHDSRNPDVVIGVIRTTFVF